MIDYKMLQELREKLKSQIDRAKGALEQEQEKVIKRFGSVQQAKAWIKATEESLLNSELKLNGLIANLESTYEKYFGKD